MKASEWKQYQTCKCLVLVFLLYLIKTGASDDKFGIDPVGSFSRNSPDTDDTFNGEAHDMVVPYPVKKYHAKYAEGKKFKIKTKSEEPSTTEAAALEVPLNLTTSTIQDGLLSNDTTPTPDVEEDIENGTVNYAEDVSEYVTTVTSLLDSQDDTAVAAATSVDQELQAANIVLDAGTITAITLGIVVIAGLIGAVSLVLYRRRYLNKPQVLTDKSSTLDSTGYIDDTSFRENSEEMYSLDNDSFLNSLEAMTIHNYWTETVKHTKL